MARYFIVAFSLVSVCIFVWGLDAPPIPTIPPKYNCGVVITTNTSVVSGWFWYDWMANKSRYDISSTEGSEFRYLEGKQNIMYIMELPAIDFAPPVICRTEEANSLYSLAGPNFFKNYKAAYLGTEYINGIECYKWHSEIAQFSFWDSVVDRTPVRYDLPGLQYDYIPGSYSATIPEFFTFDLKMCGPI
eukprot:TRINITY_DN7878_c0_g1_i1.p1 TRINITY_DN7878_c0_g1~~TRINITY_DN7878_c0_g1_i1.p1  ORF type:complete len:189 (-),score=16.85 TRINITY_DN7878_c0_g1_i1:143-709(-)